MARSLSLAAYSIQIWNLEERDGEVISDFGDEGDDLMVGLSQLLSSLKVKPSHNKKNRQLLTVEDLDVDDDSRTLRGIIETGEYGSESRLRNVDTHEIVHKRNVKEADMLPFYFLFDLPAGSEDGILILQRTGMLGIRKILSEILDFWCDGKYPGYQLRLHPLAEPGDLEKYAEGQVESIRFISYQVPSDIADALKTTAKKFTGHVELVVMSRRGSFLNAKDRVRRFFKKEVPLSKFIALNETNFKYEDVKVKTKVGGSRRTVSLGGLKLLRSYYDITEKVDIDAATGHPRFDSIDALAENLVVKVKAGLGIRDGEE